MFFVFSAEFLWTFREKFSARISNLHHKFPREKSERRSFGRSFSFNFKFLLRAAEFRISRGKILADFSLLNSRCSEDHLNQNVFLGKSSKFIFLLDFGKNFLRFSGQLLTKLSRIDSMCAEDLSRGNLLGSFQKKLLSVGVFAKVLRIFSW